MQKHDARSLHYDFRLELGGVLLSWAIPKGPTLDPGVKRLAMQTEDHPLDYGDFEGVIPAGAYGGGTVLVWDRGTWRPEGDAEEMYRKGRLSFELDGEKLHGRFHLVRGGSRGGKRDERRWLFFKGRDDAARPGSDAQLLEELPRSVTSGRDLDAVAADPDHVWTSRATPERSRAAARGRGKGSGAAAGLPLSALGEQPQARRRELPERIEPQLATLAPDAPDGDDWLHEIKLDGYRILARLEGGHARLLSRRGQDWTSRLPSIASALAHLDVESGWLDGEVVVLRENGVSDFQTLLNSMQAGRDVACTYFVFDAPFLGGYDLRAVPLSQRKALLRPLLEGARQARLRLSDHVRGAGAAFFQRACGLGLEGIVSKRADAPYTSGRGRAWLKVKCLSRQELVIGGYTEPAGSRAQLGALLLGVREGGQLVYVGKVGTGFTRASLAELAARLGPLERAEPPFANPPGGAERRGVHWVEPRLVAEVAFTERTQGGLIRHASFQGLREDKAPEEVRLESADASAAPRRGRAATTAPSTRARRAAAATGATAAARTSPRAAPAKAGARARAGAAKDRTRAAAAPRRPASVEPEAPEPRPGTARSKPSTARSKPSAMPKASAVPKASAARSKPSTARSKPSAARSKPSAARSKPSTAMPKASTARSKPSAAARAARASDGGASPRAGTPAALTLDPTRLEITNPDRVLFPEPGITKRDLMIYYARVAPWMLPQVINRPLMLVRCPEGAGGDCFHQKHPSRGMPRAVAQVLVPQKKGQEANLVIHDVEGLIGLVQMGALEIHAWGSRADRVEYPDQLVFDLDPDEGLPWPRVVEAAHTLRERLAARGLTGFPRVTGGKGLHVVVPVEPTLRWDEAKAFTAGVAEAIVAAEPGKYVATMTKQKRRGKIFIDYFRNGRGATAVCSYSTRARPGAPVALPIAWEELEQKAQPPGPFGVENIERRLAGYRDPWRGFDDARAPISLG